MVAAFLAVAIEVVTIILGLIAIAVVAAKGKRPWLTAAVAILLVVMFSWTYFPARPIYRYVCEHEQTGQSVRQRAAANGYLLVGEGGDQYDGLGFNTALDDLLSKRVDFVEIQKLPHNNLPHIAMFMYVPADKKGWQTPGVFRFWISDTQSAKECESSAFAAIGETLRSRLKPNECLAMVERDKPSSRYMVELFERSPVPLIPVKHFGVRIEDLQSKQEMAVISIFENVPRPFFVLMFGLRETDVQCPWPRPRGVLGMTQLHRYVLLTLPVSTQPQ